MIGMIASIIHNTPAPEFLFRITRWHLRYLAGKVPAPLAFGLYITSACNFRCHFCNIHRHTPPFTVPEDDAVHLAEQLGRMGLIYFSISGGEPLLVPHVFQVLDKARKAGTLYTHIVSNGWLLDDAKAIQFAKARVSEISLSLDGPEDKHDESRGMPGAYRRVLDAVERVKTHAPRTHITLNAIFKPNCPEDALHAANVAESLRVQIKIQPENNHPPLGETGQAPLAERHFTPEIQARIENALTSLARMKHVANSRPFLKNYANFLFRPKRLALCGKDCIFGFHHMESFNRQITPCLEGTAWRDGTPIAGLDLAAMLASTEYRERLDALRPCPGCQKNYYVCYYEPRLNFPLWNFLRFRLPHIR